MLFNSLVFLIFAACFFAVWPFARDRKNLRYGWIFLASMLFYGWWDWRFLSLILFSGLIDYYAGLAMVRFPGKKKLWLAFSLLGNLGTLAIFKYAKFAVANLNLLLGVIGLDNLSIHSTTVSSIILPVGISFYTFQSMSYTIDIFRGELKPTRNVLHFLAYLSMFPQLVAGPIIRARSLLPQLAQTPKATDQQLLGGLKLIAMGFVKKMVFADNFAPYVRQAIFADNPLDSSPFWWLMMIIFAYQIYCDFSGYSDIARGLAKWMGYEFPLNFDHPYIATGFNDFWSRWHISLSSWFRDYVYIPLGGSRTGKARAIGNLWATMLVSGLWHGASWTFVLWGAVHALYLTIERYTRWTEKLCRVPFVGKAIAQLLVFALVVVAWTLFVARDIDQAWCILHTMFDFTATDLPKSSKLIPSFIRILLGIIIARQVYFALEIDKKLPMPRKLSVFADAMMIVILLAAAVFLRGPASAFIYFDF